MQQSDIAIFDFIYVKHHPTLRKLAARYGLHDKETEDMIRETFLSYFTNYPIDWEEKKMKVMVARILKNKCIEYSRKNWRKHLSLDTESSEEGGGFINFLVSKDLISVNLEREECRKFWKAMKGMRSNCQEVFLLYFIQDYSIEKVSKILGITENACRTRIGRGYKYLFINFLNLYIKTE